MIRQTNLSPAVRAVLTVGVQAMKTEVAMNRSRIRAALNPENHYKPSQDEDATECADVVLSEDEVTKMVLDNETMTKQIAEVEEVLSAPVARGGN